MNFARRKEVLEKTHNYGVLSKEHGNKQKLVVAKTKISGQQNKVILDSNPSIK